jgi:uncharacterized protein YccT (UPF0319 family)
MLAAYMVFAIMGTFILVLTESFPEVDVREDNLTPVGIFSSIDYSIDCVAENSSLTGKAGRNSLSTTRNGMLRIEMPIGLQNTEMFFSCLSLKTIEETNHFNKKNSIRLQLRI